IVLASLTTGVRAALEHSAHDRSGVRRVLNALRARLIHEPPRRGRKLPVWAAIAGSTVFGTWMISGLLADWSEAAGVATALALMIAAREIFLPRLPAYRRVIS